MTDPTPTRAEVLLRRLREPAFGTETTERNLMAEAADMIQALRERAEAAETAAWNDAVEAAEAAYAQGFAAIRTLRRDTLPASHIQKEEK